MFIELDVIVDGALEETVTFTDDTAMRDFIATVEDEARDHGYPVDVYVQYHDHEPFDDGDDEDVCGQYETDHHPYVSFNI